MPIEKLNGTPTRGLLGSVHDSIRHNGVIKKAKETRPTFDELKAIEKTRREVLLRVSEADNVTYVMYCISHQYVLYYKLYYLSIQCQYFRTG